jgi:hypothetical protein
MTVGQHIARPRCQATVEGRLMKEVETGGLGLPYNHSSSLANVAGGVAIVSRGGDLGECARRRPRLNSEAITRPTTQSALNVQNFGS